MGKATYHHGDLRRALLRAAGEAISETGVAALSMRDLARRAGVTHAAPTHHFRDKAGLLTALATEGFERLAAALATARAAGGDLLEMGVTYVRFAVAHQGMFEVMFRPDLYHADDPALLAARAKADDSVYAVEDECLTGLAVWSAAHGFATLWLTGALAGVGADAAEMARKILTELKR